MEQIKYVTRTRHRRESRGLVAAERGGRPGTQVAEVTRPSRVRTEAPRGRAWGCWYSGSARMMETPRSQSTPHPLLPDALNSSREHAPQPQPPNSWERGSIDLENVIKLIMMANWRYMNTIICICTVLIT